MRGKLVADRAFITIQYEYRYTKVHFSVIVMLCKRLPRTTVLLVGDGELNIHTRVDSHGGDVLNNAERRLQVDHTLVDLHLESIPSLGA